MAEFQQPTFEFLTWEEASEVDKALLTSAEKFSTRIAIYALRVLKQISQEESIPVSEILPERILAWVAKDNSIQQKIEVDSSFLTFFTRLVTASLNPLKRIAQASDTPMESLSIQQVVAGFEQESKAKLQQ